MKKLKYLLFVLLLIPVFVFAKDKDIEFRDIVLKNISPNTVILKDAEFEKDEFQLDLQMFEVGDFIEYQFTIYNYTNKDYKIKTNSFNKTINSVQYKILSNDNSYIVKSNSSKNFIVRVSYVEEVSSKDYSLNEYDASSKITLDIDKTGLSSLSFTEDDLDLTLVSNISIDSMTPHPCSSGLSLSQGTEYVNGQYTYRYRQQNNGGTSWTNISGFIYGWGVHLTNTASTDPVTTTLCTSIDNYPIISMAYMFAGSMASSIDLSSFNTSNVISMDRMFVNASNVTSLDFSTFNTHKVTNMSSMFTHCTSLLELDLSNFYTYKVTAMDSMFNSCTSLTNLDISNFNTSNVTTMSAMFFNCTNLTEINMSGFDFSQNSSICSVIGGLFAVTGSLKKINMSNWKLSADMSNSIFRCTGAYDSPIEEIDVTGWDLSNTTYATGMLGAFNTDATKYNLGLGGNGLKTIKGLDTWNTSHITDMTNMFGSLSSLIDLNLSSFDTSNVTNMDSVFYGCTSLTTGYARTQADADKFNNSSNKPSGFTFVVKI